MFRENARPRRLVRLALLLGSLGLGLFLANRLFLRWTRIGPPPGAGVGVARPPVQMRGLREYIGANWAGRERGIWEFHLTGEPFSLGYAHDRMLTVDSTWTATAATPSLPMQMRDMQMSGPNALGTASAAATEFLFHSVVLGMAKEL